MSLYDDFTAQQSKGTGEGDGKTSSLFDEYQAQNVKQPVKATLIAPEMSSAVSNLIKNTPDVKPPQGNVSFPKTNATGIRGNQTIFDSFPKLQGSIIAGDGDLSTEEKKMLGLPLANAANLNLPNSTPNVTGVNVAKNLATTLMAIPKTVVELVKGIYKQETNPDADVREIEKNMPGGSELLGSTKDKGLVGATVQDLSIPAKIMTRFFAPIIQGAGQNIADAVISNNDKAKEAFGPTDEKGNVDISLLPSASESVLQGVGNFMQLAFAVATPEIGGKLGLGKLSEATGADILKTLAGKSASEAFMPLAKIVGKQMASAGLHGAEAGLWFGTAQALQSGSKDPAEIGTMIFKSSLGLGLLGAIMSGAKISADITKTALTKNIIGTYNLPRTVYISADKINEYVNTGKLTDAEAKELFDQIGGLGELQRQAKEQGTNVNALKNTGAFFNIPLEDMVQITDKPWFAKVKEAFGVEPSTEAKQIIPGKASLGMAKQLLAPGETVKGDSVTNAIKDDIAENLSRDHSPEHIIEELQKETGASAEHATAIVKEVAKEKGIEVPGVTDTGETDIMAEMEKAAQAVQEKSGENGQAEVQKEGEKSVEKSDAQETPKDVSDVLGELSDSDESHNDWADNYQPKYTELSDQLDKIDKQIKSTKDKGTKNSLVKQGEKIGDNMAKIENDFIAKYESKAKEIVKQKEVKENAKAVAKGEKYVSKTEVGVEAPEEGYTRYEVNVDGQKIFADYNPSWLKSGDTIHIEWRSSGPNPISETGYRSDFIMGSEKDNGITKENIQQELQKRAEVLAKEEAPVRAKRQRELDRINKQENNKKQDATNNNNSKRGVSKGGNTESGGVDGQELESNRGKNTESSQSVARGKRGERSPSTRERSGTQRGGKVAWNKLAPKNEKTIKLSNSFGTAHWQIKGEPPAEFSAQEKKDLKIEDIPVVEKGGSAVKQMAEFPMFGKKVGIALLSENGVKVAVDSDYFNEIKKLLPDTTAIVPDTVGKAIKFEKGGEILGVIMPLAGFDDKMQEVLGGKNDQDRVQEVEAQAEEKREAIGTTNDEIQNIVDTKTIIDANGEVQTPKSEKDLSNDEREIINAYTGAGGNEKAGAEGRGLLDEYYTPSDVSSVVGAILGDVGAFTDNMDVLEPSAGVGAFLGDIPENAVVDAHEINPTAARILKLNYPSATVKTTPFESLFMTDRGNKLTPKKQYDLVIGNPPYGEHRGKYKGLGEESKIGRYEEYFLKRALDVTKDGGHVAMVVPSGFLRGGPSVAKAEISKVGELVQAYRLPNGTFPTTDIGTDIVIFKKETHFDIETPKALLSDDTYFTKNPGNVLGETGTRKGKFGEEVFVKGTLEEAVDKFYATKDEIYAKQESSDDEVVAGIEQELAESYKPDVLKEVRTKEKTAEKIKETDAEQAKADSKKLEKNKKVVEKTKSDGKTLELSKYSTADESEGEMWKFVQPTGELKGDFDKTKAYYVAGSYFNKFNYLQGDIYEKLDQLEEDKGRGKLTDEQYKTQKEALKSVLPATVSIDRLSVTPNSRFAQDMKLTMPVKSSEYQPFGRPAKETMEDTELSLADHFIQWINGLPMSAFGESNSYAIKGYVRNQPVRGGDKLRNEQERRTRRAEGDRLFKLFLRENLPAKEVKAVEEQYNRQFNAYHRPDYREVPLVGELNSTFKGKPLEIRDVQLQGIGFLVNRGLGLLAHDVGVGKTMQSIIAINEMLARGWAKKPLIVTPSPNVYQQWIKEIKELLPNAKINLLANLGGDFKGDLSSLEIPDGSISVITEEGFKRLGFSNETYTDLTADFHDVISDPNEGTKRETELGKSKAETEVAKGIKGTKTEKFFEELGFDHITIDEVHNANHIIARAKAEEGKVSEFKGFQVKPSQFGIKTWLAAQYIQKKYNGRNVSLASATPFTNNPLEYYSILSLMARERMKRMGILNVNDFMTAFMEISTQHEFKADGSYLEKSEVRSFKNYQQFQKLLTEFIDFRDGVEAGVQRPDRVSHEYVVGETEDAVKYKELAQELFKDKEHAGALKAISELRAVAFSPYLSRYYDGKAPTASDFVENSPKIKTVVEMIKQSLKDKPEGGHLIYSPVGVEFFPLLKQALIDATGLPAKEVDIISGSTSKPRRSSIQEAFNAGDVKIVIGSDAIKEGVNLQENTTDLHILSLPWNFTEVRQVIGRGWRQGNKWPRIRINTYFTENSVDIFLSQKLQNKEKRYEQALQFKGDELDVGDINFEEMKLDLITDPVRRVELEYQLKEQELELEIKRKLAEQGYKNRRAADLVEAMQKVNQYEEYVKGKDGSWAQQSLMRARENLKEIRLRLKDRGIDVDAISKELDEAEKEVADIRKKIDILEEEKNKAIEGAKTERENNLGDIRDTDYGSFIKDREEENKTFYDKPTERVALSAVGGKIKLDDWSHAMDKALTPEEKEAISEQILMVQHGEEVPKETMKLVDSAYKKYLDFMGETKKDAMSLAAEKDGLPFNMPEEKAYEWLGARFDEKEISFLFPKNIIQDHGSGREAWGRATPARAFKNPIIEAVINNGFVQNKILYEEAFHTYLASFVPKEEKETVFSNIMKNPFLTGARQRLLDQGYTNDEIANEYISKDFATYVASQDGYTKANKSFYQKILDKIYEWIRKITGLKNLYDRFLERQQSGRFKENRVVDLSKFDDLQDEAVLEAKLSSIGKDSDLAKDLEMSREDFAKKMAESSAFDDQNRDLIRKDISSIENLTAQARDIYLRDPNEFAAAGAFEKAADNRRVKKSSLDKYFSDVMKPYYKDLPKNDQEKVNKVLMAGDLAGEEYTNAELTAKNLNAKQIDAYKAVRKAFNTAHQYLLNEMRKNGVPEDEIKEYEAQRAGYMPHKWKYRYAVKHQVRTKEGPWHTYQMDNFKSEHQAREAFEALKVKNSRADVRYTLDTLDNLDVDFFSEQRLSFDAIRSAIVQAKSPQGVKDVILEALRDMVKEKGFGRQYMRRTGTRGYEQEAVPKIMADYFSGMNGYITKMEAGKQYYQILSTIDARRQNKFYGWMRDMIAYDMGHTKEWQGLKATAFAFYLANDISFLLTNATQNFQVGTGELSKYMAGAQKIIGPEMRIIKAMSDYNFGNITPEEKKTIDSIVSIGGLGGQMTSELMGFKNNPLYTEISSRFNKVMYGSTAFVERKVNRVPAFLAARRLFLEQGMSEKEANQKAMDVSDDIHFRYGKQNRPRFERGRLGSLFVFYHYMRSLIYQLSRDLSQGEFLSFGRKMFYTALIGGTTSLPFAGSILAIYKLIFGTTCDAGDKNACKAASEDIPEWEIALERGLPATVGVDMSGRVGIDLMSISSIAKNPDDVKSYLGALGSLWWFSTTAANGGRIQQSLEMIREGRIEDALGKLTPDMLANPITAYKGYTTDVTSFKGTPLQDADGNTFKYNSWEAIIRATGFTPTRQNLAYDANNNIFLAQDQAAAAHALVRRTVEGQVQRGDFAGARETQQKAIDAGTISEDTNYIKEFGKDTFIKDALTEWNNTDHTRANLDQIEKGLIQDIYGDKATPTQGFNLQKEFAVYRAFGLSNKLVTDIQKAPKTADAVQVLMDARDTMGPDAFLEFMKKGRKVIQTPAGNDSYILISDDLLDAYKKARAKAGKTE